MAERKRFGVVFEGVEESFELATDEGPFHGGDGTGLPPLALFAAALTGCLMTQIRACSKRMEIPLDGPEVRARLHRQGEQDGADPYVRGPVGFDLEVDMGSDAPLADR